MHSKAAVARALSEAFLAGTLDADALVERGARLLGKQWRWLGPLAQRVCNAFGGRPRPRRIAVAKFILGDAGFLRVCDRHVLTLTQRLAPPPIMSPVSAASSWNVPVIRTSGELADWLGIGAGELEWFADLKYLESKRGPGRLRHYHYRMLAKRFGAIRLIEAPKPRLKQLQRQILDDILAHVPPHSAAHGFRRGRSIKSFATPHVGQRVVLRIDMQDFFPSISAARVGALFRTVGYPERVAELLGGLCTNRTPENVWEHANLWETGVLLPPAESMRRASRLYARPHLPQGAPTSPALANLCAYRLDCRIGGLAESAGAIYTRYADDLAFSGGRDFERVVKRFCIHVSATAMEEGFSVHHRKTRIMRKGARQRLAGVVVNRRTNVSRTDYDRLKATLTNCRRHGAASQNRTAREDFRAHLLGRISFVEMLNPTRGGRLRELFDRIEW
jgi:RNA-directed DNA polymerase